MGIRWGRGGLKGRSRRMVAAVLDLLVARRFSCCQISSTWWQTRILRWWQGEGRILLGDIHGLPILIAGVAGGVGVTGGFRIAGRSRSRIISARHFLFQPCQNSHPVLLVLDRVCPFGRWTVTRSGAGQLPTFRFLHMQSGGRWPLGQPICHPFWRRFAILARYFTHLRCWQSSSFRWRSFSLWVWSYQGRQKQGAASRTLRQRPLSSD